MEKSNLHEFREKWLCEIQFKNDKDSSILTDENYEQNQGDETLVQSTHMNVPSLSFSPTSSTQNDNYPTAFEIANKYLSDVSPEQCQYCQREFRDKMCKNDRKINKCVCIKKQAGLKRRSHFDVEKKSLKGGGKFVKWNFIDDEATSDNGYAENLIDLLIADIDEITCIPFFDLELPKEIAVHVFRYLSLTDLSTCCLVNSKWKVIAEDDLIWFHMCSLLGVTNEYSCAAERIGWKTYVRENVLERRRIQSKWKERFCEVRDLENEKGGILCSAGMYNDTLISAYIDGSIRLWNLKTGSYGHNLKEQYTSDEEVVTSLCTCTAINETICVAGFQNGDVMVWQRGGKNRLSGTLIFMRNFESSDISIIQISEKWANEKGALVCLISLSSFFVMKPDENKALEEWKWETALNVHLEDKIVDFLLIDTDPCSLKMVVSIRSQIRVYTLHPGGYIVLETLVDATFSCVDYKSEFLVVGINSVGYSVLGGYRIRKYCLNNGNQVSNIIGSYTEITCLNYADCQGDQVVIGCSDLKIRIHDFRTDTLLFTINGINTKITTLQMDEWKVVSGHKDGSVCLWDCTNGALYWQTSLKHPVQICHFDDEIMTIVNIPKDKFPQNSNWYADDLIQHRRYRGSIRVMDFTRDALTVGVPNECRAEYDNITGYDYNIQLIAPYDDVTALNLPKL